ncbi:hypothetical protein ACWGFX_18195 [Streptomyces xanthophaeus]
MSGSVGVSVKAPSSPGEGTAGVWAGAADALAGAAEFAVVTQSVDGGWHVPAEPRILETAVVACSLADVEGAKQAHARAVEWLAGAEPQQHDAFVTAADRWLVTVTTGGPAALAHPQAPEGPHARRAMYLHAVACAVKAPGADPRRLLADARRALEAGAAARVKPWQRAMLLAFEAIARHTLGQPANPVTVEEYGRAQSADGTFYAMPFVTGVVHLALNLTAPGHPVTRRCLQGVLDSQHADGTWRFLVADIWDTGLMVRALRGHPHFDQAALPAALAYLHEAQNEDGGWACNAEMESDNDTTGNTLLALADTPWTTHGRAAAAGYARRLQTPEGLWTTWHSSDDTPTPDVTAHMAAGTAAAGLPGIDLAPARRWLTAQAKGGHWPSDWYVPPAYGAAEIAVHFATPPQHHETITALLHAQRADGGWPRLADEAYSSPTATGLALTALTAPTHSTDGSDDATSPAVERAVRFLTRTQTGEGTWHDRPIMTGPRPFLSVTPAQVHALAARGLRDALTHHTSGHSR